MFYQLRLQDGGIDPHSGGTVIGADGSYQTRLIKTGGRLVRHARRLVFQLAEVLVLPRKEGNADGDTGTDLQATLGTWLAHLGSAGIGQIVVLTLLRVVYLTLRIYLFIILIYVVLSWISPGTYNPAVNLLSSIADPVLRPLRRVIPTIAGLDLSALFAIIGIQAFTMILPIGQAMSGLVCTSVGQLF